MSKIQIEIDEKYKEALELLKQVIPNHKGGQIENNGEMVEVLIDSFMAFIQEQAGETEQEEGGHCGSGGCGCGH